MADVEISFNSDVQKYIAGLERALQKTQQVGKSAKGIKDEFQSSVPILGQMATVGGAFALAWQGVGAAVSFVRQELERARQATQDIGVGLRGVIAGAGLSANNAQIQEAVRRQATAPGSLLDVKESTASIASFVSTATNANATQIEQVLGQAQAIERAGISGPDRETILAAAGALIESSNLSGGNATVARAAELATAIMQESGGGRVGSSAVRTYQAGVVTIGYQYAEEIAALVIAAAKGGQGASGMSFLTTAFAAFAERGSRGSLIDFVRRFGRGQTGVARLGATAVAAGLTVGREAVAGSAGTLDRMAGYATATDRMALAGEARRVAVSAAALDPRSQQAANTADIVTSTASLTAQNALRGEGVLDYFSSAATMNPVPFLQVLFRNASAIQSNTAALEQMNNRPNPMAGDER